LKLKPHWNEQDALGYYVQRIKTLEAYAQEIADPQHSFFLTYETLIEQTPAALLALQNFLELKMPLSETYRLTRQTGMKGVGDSSDKIKAGQIIRSQSDGTFALAEENLRLATLVFEQCQTTLSQVCQVTQPSPENTQNIATG
jgi:hypothetical protein